jgi:predicted nucleic acid-binding protein
MGASESGAYRLERVTPQRFSKAWQLRWRYADQAAISFVDFTSFVVMNELGIRDVFTGDSHFEQINMGFQLFPRSL